MSKESFEWKDSNGAKIKNKKLFIFKKEITEIKGDALPKYESELYQHGSTDQIRYSGIGESY